MKRAYLIHGWGGHPDGAFRPWLARKLRARGFEVEIPELPDTEYPRIETWVPFLTSFIRTPDKDTVIVGHSLGCQAVLRFLEKLPEGASVGKTVLVAGPFTSVLGLEDEEKEVVQPWLRTPVDVDKVKRAAGRLIAFFSDNDPWIPLEDEKIAREVFGAETIIQHKKGHYSEVDGLAEVPDVLVKILEQ